MNNLYLVPGAAVTAGFGLRGEWHGVAIPGDVQGRWIVLCAHPDDADESAMRAIPGVVAFPNITTQTPLSQAAVNLLSGFGVGITIADTVGSALDKLRAAWPKAAAFWR